MSDDDPTPAFWACDVVPGGTVTQIVPAGSSLCLTGAGLAPGSETTRSTLWATSAGSKAVLANLSSVSGHGYVRLGQPFSGRVAFSVVGARTVHLSGFSRGTLPAVTGSLKGAAGKAGKAKAAPAEADDGSDDEEGEEEESEEDEDEGEGEELDLEEVERVLTGRSLGELQEMCVEMQLPKKGGKPALIERIMTAMKERAGEEESDDEEGEEGEEGDESDEGEEGEEEEEEGEEEEKEEMDVEEVQKRLMAMDHSELEMMLKEMELPKGGGKKEMVGRLIEAMQACQEEGDSEEEEEEGEEEDEELDPEEARMRLMALSAPKLNALLKERGLKLGGEKAEIVERLLESMLSEEGEEGESEEGEEEEGEEEEGEEEEGEEEEGEEEEGEEEEGEEEEGEEGEEAGEVGEAEGEQGEDEGEDGGKEAGE